MPGKLAPIVAALKNLGDAIKASNTAATTTLRQNNGWNFPNLTAPDAAKLAYALANRIDQIDPDRLNPKFDIARVVARIDEDTASLPGNFWNGNGNEAFRAYTALLDWVEADFSSLFISHVDWETVSKADEMPAELAKKARSIAARLKSLGTKVGDLDERITTINAAHDAALALPTDLESLEEARDRIEESAKTVEKDSGIVATNAEKVAELLEQVTASRDEAVKLVQRTEDAYSAATTLGLGAAFEARAKSLARSMWVWVAGLFFGLIAGGIIGWLRITVVEDLLKSNASVSAVWLNAMFAGLSLAAPVWLAWVATKQIGQRFRLSEDYAYKASVAKAYEGYRREAARLDPAFATQLFKSALERLEEPPLRYVEHESYGSPWHEAIRLRAGQAKAKLFPPKPVSEPMREPAAAGNDDAEETTK